MSPKDESKLEETPVSSEYTDYEGFLQQAGGFGRYQIRVFILVSLFETPVAWAMLLPILTGASSEWMCPGFNTTLNNSSQTASMSDNNNTQCQICPDIQYTAQFTSIITEWHLICERDNIPSLITSLQMAGVLVGALITGQLADLFGRRKCLYITYMLLLIFWLASAFTTSWYSYAVMRALVGVCVGGVMLVNFVLPLEFVTPRWRTFCGCIGFWAVGVMSLGLWGYLIRDWRHVTIGTCICGIPILLSWWFVPESPRWLLSKGRVEEAEQILCKMAIFNGKPEPEFSNLHSYAEREENIRKQQKKYSYWHLCSSWRLAKNSLILMYGWFVSSSVYYGMSLNAKNLAGDRYLNMFVLGVVELPAVILVVLVNNSLGRRKTTCMLMLIASLSCLGILLLVAFEKADVLPEVVLCFAVLGKFGIAGAWAAVQVFSAETFPTVIRNIGVGSCSMAARIGGIVAPQFVFLDKHGASIPYAIFGACAILCAILSFALPETNKIPLPDQLQSHEKTNGHLTTELINGNQEMEEIPLNCNS